MQGFQNMYNLRAPWCGAGCANYICCICTCFHGPIRVLNPIICTQKNLNWETRANQCLGVHALLYVDDMVLASTGKRLRERVVERLLAEYEMKFEGELHWILGMRVTRNRTLRTICLDQSLYVSSLCSRFGMDRCHPTSTPASPSESLTSLLCPSSEEERVAVADFPYSQGSCSCCRGSETCI